MSRTRPRAARAAVGLIVGLLGSLHAGAQAQAAGEPLVFIAPANHAMPLVEIRQGQLTRGILKDLGEAIAAKLGRQAQFLIVPSKRVSAALDQGEADVLCYGAPRWVEATRIQWSRPVFDYAGVVARRADAPAVQDIGQLAGERLGTVAGYRYIEVEAALGANFLRDDAPDMGRNLAKLAAGRVRYAMTEQLTLAYAMRQSPGTAPVQALTTVRYPTHCAFSTRRSTVPLAQLERAVDALVTEGTVDRILAQYR